MLRKHSINWAISPASVRIQNLNEVLNSFFLFFVFFNGTNIVRPGQDVKVFAKLVSITIFYEPLSRNTLVWWYAHNHKSNTSTQETEARRVNSSSRKARMLSQKQNKGNHKNHIHTHTNHYTEIYFSLSFSSAYIKHNHLPVVNQVTHHTMITINLRGLTAIRCYI